jgi:hypothetical protein
MDARLQVAPRRIACKLGQSDGATRPQTNRRDQDRQSCDDRKALAMAPTGMIGSKCGSRCENSAINSIPIHRSCSSVAAVSDRRSRRQGRARAKATPPFRLLNTPAEKPRPHHIYIGQLLPSFSQNFFWKFCNEGDASHHVYTGHVFPLLGFLECPLFSYWIFVFPIPGTFLTCRLESIDLWWTASDATRTDTWAGAR